jgi:hypothetical protein
MLAWLLRENAGKDEVVSTTARESNKAKRSVVVARSLCLIGTAGETVDHG